MLQTWGGDTLTNWLLLSIIPGALLSGLIQEGAKMIPVVIYWWRKNMKIDYKLGLTLGAVAGAGFGILETQWIHNMLFATGWSWDLTQSRGLEALTPFIERFFIVAFSTASSALAGYGLAKSKGWQFYLIVSILHTILTYNIILAQAKIFSFVQVEIFIAVWAILITGAALGLRWRRQAD
jgi:RsiW-degrading membrane proteinase PrsW (M82 family)